MQTPYINANALDDVLQDDSVILFVVVGQSMCGKTYLADTLVARLRDRRSPCFPVFIDEAGPKNTIAVINAAIQGVAPDRPVVIACQTYQDVSRQIAECVTLGTAIVLAGRQSRMDAEALSVPFGIDASILAAIPNREFLALRRTTN